MDLTLLSTLSLTISLLNVSLESCKHTAPSFQLRTKEEPSRFHLVGLEHLSQPQQRFLI